MRYLKISPHYGVPNACTDRAASRRQNSERRRGRGNIQAERRELIYLTMASARFLGNHISSTL